MRGNRIEVRGRGLMIGVECTTSERALSATAALLERGFVLLPSGDGGRVLSLTPPLVIDRESLFLACDAIVDVLTGRDGEEA